MKHPSLCLVEISTAAAALGGQGSAFAGASAVAEAMADKTARQVRLVGLGSWKKRSSDRRLWIGSGFQPLVIRWSWNLGRVPQAGITSGLWP